MYAQKFKYLLIYFILICNCTNAQIEKKSKLIGGSVNFHNEFINKDLTVTIGPSGGYFIYDNFAIGASLPLRYYYHYKIRNTYALGIGLSPFCKYYIELNNYYFFLRGKAGYKYTFSNKEEWRVSEKSISLGCGIAYFITKSVAIESILHYEFIEHYDRNSFLKLDFGFSIYLFNSSFTDNE